MRFIRQVSDFANNRYIAAKLANGKMLAGKVIQGVISAGADKLFLIVAKRMVWC